MARSSLQSIRISNKETLEWSTSGDPAARKSALDIERLAHWLDTLFEIPGIRVRFGIDALLGLLPGVGDTVSALASIYILRSASEFRVPRVTIARMTVNIVIDLLVGAIPIVGDMFDVYWKANRKNVELLRRHLKANPTAQQKLTRSDGFFVVAMIGVIAVVLIASMAGAYLFVTKTIGLLPGH